MMGGAPGWCQHPALGGNQEKWGHGRGPAPHHGSSVSGESLLDTTQILACEAWHMAEAHPCCVSDDELCQQLAMAETIVLEMMSLGAEIDHDSCIEWWQHPIRHKYSSLMCGSVLVGNNALCSQRNCGAIGHSQVRERGRHIQFSDCGTDWELCNINIENNIRMGPCWVTLQVKNADTNVIVITWDPWYYSEKSVLEFVLVQDKLLLRNTINLFPGTLHLVRCFVPGKEYFPVLIMTFLLVETLSISAQIASLPRSHSRVMIADALAQLRSEIVWHCAQKCWLLTSHSWLV